MLLPVSFTRVKKLRIKGFSFVSRDENEKKREKKREKEKQTKHLFEKECTLSRRYINDRRSYFFSDHACESTRKLWYGSCDF